MTRVILTLTISEKSALLTLAERELRDPRAQAALIIRRELERLGLLAADLEAGKASAEIPSGFWMLGADFWGRWEAIPPTQKYFWGGHMIAKKNKSVEGATVRYINTGGGAYVEGNIQADTFTGRDQNIAVGASIEEVRKLFTALNAAIESRPKTDAETKADLKAEVKELQTHVEEEGDTLDEGFIARRLRNIGRMAPDILDVAIAALGNPVGGLMLAIKKSAEKAKEMAGKS
jgi:hypothetical protein